MAASLTFLEAYEKDGDSILDRVVTGDETWVKHATCETKNQSMEWGHTSSPKRPRKYLQTLSARKIMATVFWDMEGVLLVDFLERGSTINSKLQLFGYSEVLKPNTGVGSTITAKVVNYIIVGPGFLKRLVLNTFSLP